LGCIIDPARKIRIGNKLYFGDDDSLVAEVIDTTSRKNIAFLYMMVRMKNLEKIGVGETQFQNTSTEVTRKMLTVTKLFMRKKKELLQPTAGLHFETFAKRLEIKGIKFAEVTLHVGLGTFNPVE
jgi:S-adenosylmethionine:tRNA ribosyltransferase-isomerase